MSTYAKLSAIWLAGFAVLLGVFLFLFFGCVKDAPSQDLLKYIQPLVLLFAPYLTPMLTFWFSARQRKGGGSSNPGFGLAVGISLIFVAGILTPLLFLFAKEMVTPQDLFDRVNNSAQIGTLLAFFVGPAIGYYFGSFE
jgi:hypothetical protein